MNNSIYLNPLYLLHQAQVSVARLGREGARHTSAGLLKLFHQYRRAFNDTAAESSENRYHDDVSRRL